MGLFKSIKVALTKTKNAFIDKWIKSSSKGLIDDDFFDELESILISSDVGVTSSIQIIEELRNRVRKAKCNNSDQIKVIFKDILTEILSQTEQETNYPIIYTVVGVNGVGKTTTIGKLANYYKNKKKNVLLVAGDTFRAAASLQLNEWAKRSNVRIVNNTEGADPAAVVFDGIKSAKAKNDDVVIVDTAGRLHNSVNLMEELKKINRIIDRECSGFTKQNLIVLDATMGQNAINQIRQFDESILIDGIIITKLDGTSKGGVIIPIINELHKPILFVGTGEGIDDIVEFDAKEYVENLI